MSVKECLEGRAIRPGTSVKMNDKSQSASKEVQYNIRGARDGSAAKGGGGGGSQCTSVRPRMSDNMTLCSPLVGVRDRVNDSYREGRKVCVCVRTCVHVCVCACVCVREGDARFFFLPSLWFPRENNNNKKKTLQITLFPTPNQKSMIPWYT